MRSRSNKRIVLLGSLYLSQGLPYGFFTQALPVLLREKDYSLEAIGLTSLLAIPWALKFLWAPLVDRVHSATLGRRRSWILPLQAGTTALLCAAALMPHPADLDLLLVGVFLVNLLSATQDIATDGLAVDILSPKERGIGNGVQVAGYRLGMIIGGGALLIAYDHVGWMGSFMLMAAIVAVAAAPVANYREASPARSESSVTASVWGFFSQPGRASLLALIAIYKFGEHFATGMLRPLLSDIGYSMADIGWILGTAGFLAGMLGALLGGALVNRIGRRSALTWFALVQTGAVAGYVLIPSNGLPVWAVYGICGVEHLASGMATAALFTCMMDWCRPKSGATDYTFQASLVVSASGFAASLSGVSAGSLGYEAHFTAATLVTATAVAAAHFLFPRSNATDQTHGQTEDFAGHRVRETIT
ncbi:MAG: MFS transporter [Myxococcota bacterium]